MTWPFSRRSNPATALPLPAEGDFIPWGGFNFFGGGGSNDSGTVVTPETALTLSSVWAAIQVISDAIAGLPLHVQAKDGSGKQYNTPLYRLLHDQPNDYMTAVSFRTALMHNVLLYGNGYAFIERDTVGRPIALLPMLARTTRPYRKDGELFYQTSLPDGKTYTLPQESVFHILGATIDGLNGLSPIDYARQTCGISLALEKFSASFFGKGCTPSGTIEAPAMKPEAAKEYAANLRATYAGIGNANSLMLLTHGATWKASTVTPRDSQAVEQREHQIREVARIYKIPPHKLADLSRASFSNIESQTLQFQQDCIAPWAIRLEQEFERKLLLEVERPTIEIKFNLDSLLRSDIVSRYAANASALQAGWQTVNEIRAREGMPSLPGGDVLRAPLNMGPADPAAEQLKLNNATQAAADTQANTPQQDTQK